MLSGVGSGAASEADFFFYPAAAGAAPYPTLYPRTRAAGARLPLGPSVAGPLRQRGRRLAGPRARRARAGAARVPQLGHVGQLTVTPARVCVLAARAFVPAPPGQARCPPGQAHKRYQGAPLALEQSREAPRARARTGPDAWLRPRRLEHPVPRRRRGDGRHGRVPAARPPRAGRLGALAAQPRGRRPAGERRVGARSRGRGGGMPPLCKQRLPTH